MSELTADIIERVYAGEQPPSPKEPPIHGLVGVGGGSWALDVPEGIPSVWGEGQEVAWAEGEALFVVGTDGAGKSVLAQNLTLRISGLVDEPLLGLPVQKRKRVLYLAQDRPKQIRRSFRRMIGDAHRDYLDDVLRVVDWPIGLLDSDPEMLVRLAAANDADTLILDSVKDVMSEPSKEGPALAIRRAYSLAIAEGVECCLLHHDRKAIQGAVRRKLKLDDIYGNRFLFGGAGSVLILNGRSGDPIVELQQVKQAAAEFGPIRVVYDFDSGAVDIHEGSDLYSIVRNSKGVTAKDAARILHESHKPTAAEVEKVRRKLKALVDKGYAHEKPGTGQEPAIWYPKTRAEPPTG